MDFREFMYRWNALAEGGRKATLLGVGPMSPRVVRGALLSAHKHQFPLMLIASRNQVDSDNLGGGYVASWDQRRFARFVKEEAIRIGFSGPVFLCRDHGGPWQRDNEYRAGGSYEQAVVLAKQSFLDDLKAGFHMLHVDPTKDPGTDYVALEVVLQRAVELIQWIEEQRRGLGIGPVGYEVGTEETRGGLTEASDFENFAKELTHYLRARGLPQPSFVVGQTGTLVRSGRNVGRVDFSRATELATIANQLGMGLKEHNADYLDDARLSRHPGAGIAAANVAPEFGTVETSALLDLAEMEAKSHPVTGSDLASKLLHAVKRSGRWRKWFPQWSDVPTEGQPDAAGRLSGAALEVVRACGHYALYQPAVAAAMERMFSNLEERGINADKEVVTRLEAAVSRYVGPFNLEGTTDLL